MTARFAIPFLLAPSLALAETPARAPAPAAGVAALRYAPLAAPVMPRPARHVLGNGLVIMLLPDRDLPLVEGTVLVKAGARLEPAEKVGLAGLTAQVLRTGGAGKMTGDALDDLIEGMGASLELGAGSDQMRGSFSCLAGDLDRVLAAVAAVLREPAFAPDKLEVAKNQARSAIARRNDNAAAIAPREFAKLVYGKDAVYARHTEYATIAAVTRDDLVRYHAAHVHPNATILGLAGDFDLAGATALVEKHFGSWARGPAPGKFEGGFTAGRPGGVYLVEKADVNQSNIWIGHTGITSDNPDVYAVAVMNEVFGGGFSARLFSNVRSKKGLAYSVGGSIGDDYDHPGIFRVSMSTKSATTVDGIAALRQEIEAIRKAPPTDEELKRAKDALLNSFIFRFDTRQKVLQRQLDYEFYGYPLDFLDRYPERIRKVTAADVRAVAEKYIHPDQLSSVVVGNSGEFGTPLSALGQSVVALDVTIPGAPVAPAGGK
jgi:zinc protease